jgi:hypothetical protein
LRTLPRLRQFLLIPMHQMKSLSISCKITQAFGIRTLVDIVPRGDPRNVGGVHPRWFLPPFEKGGRGDFWYKSTSEIPPSPLFQRGDFLHYLGLPLEKQICYNPSELEFNISIIFGRNFKRRVCR